MITRSLTNISVMQTGKLDSNAFNENGIYSFFTCALKSLKINTYVFDEDASLLVGNNASCNFHRAWYICKFNTYQIKPKSGYDIDYIYYSIRIQLELLKRQYAVSHTKFLIIKILDGIQIEGITLDEQKKIAQSILLLDSKIKKNNDMVQKLQFFKPALNFSRNGGMRYAS